MPAGRPAAFDEAEQKMFCSLIGLGFTVDAAAVSVGFSALTARRALRRKPEFMKEYRDARIGVCANSLFTLRNAASKDWRAARWYIERLMPQPFGKKETDLTMEAAQTMYDEALHEIRSVLPKGKLRRRGMRRLMKLASAWYKHLTPDGNLAKKSRISKKEAQRIIKRLGVQLPPASTLPESISSPSSQSSPAVPTTPLSEPRETTTQIDLNTT
jgi:hypothetical protein